MEPSKYQQAVYDHMNTGRNLMVEAVAGSGKTTTIIGCMKFIPFGSSATFVCFNKSIAKELQARVPAGVQACTMHSYGYAAIKKQGWVKVVGEKTKWTLKDQFDMDDKDQMKHFYAILPFVSNMISLLKAHLWTERSLDQVYTLELAQQYGHEEPSKEWFSYMQETWERCLRDRKRCDFDDMIYWPILFGLDLPKSDYVFVDEAQDLNPVQIEMVSRMYHTKCIVVGDTYQAIYGFRGADAEAMQKLKDKLNADVLPLSICYRCDSKIIEEAKQIVPHIEARTDAPEGQVNDLSIEKFHEALTDGDYVLCRVTAPLVQHALRLIAAGRRAVVMGREIGQGLIKLIESVTDSNDIKIFLAELQAYRVTQAEKLEKRGRDAELIMLHDKCDTLEALASEALSVKAMHMTIDQLFDENASGGVTFSTIHKSKGLEADRIFILRPDVLPHPMAKKPWQQVQEKNLKYVAVTRAKHELFWVIGE
jgi:DNA helicase-2/ATP-dependent DNA helicase PcrA